MGYYTWYTLEILKDPDDQEDEFFKELDEKLNSILKEY